MSTEFAQSQQVPATARMNGQAVVALVTGILSLVFFWGGWLFVAMSCAAVVTGVRGGRAARTGRGQQGIATAGLIIGILAAVLQFFFLVSTGRP